MKNLSKEQVMALEVDDLLKYINHMLADGYSLERLNKEKGIRRQTIRDRLKKHGYIYDKNTNSYIQSSEINEEKSEINREPQNKPQEKPKQKLEQITLDKVLERLESLEMRFKAIEENQKGSKVNNFELIHFNSEEQARNYPLHMEVIELLAEVSKANPHLKVKDIVNHSLYIGLRKVMQRESIE